MAERRKDGMAGVIGKPRWRESDARVVIEALERSGQDLSRFAVMHGLVPQRVRRWAEKLGPRLGAAVSFHPVRMIGAGGRGPIEAIEIVLVDGRRVRVPEGFASRELERVLGVLEGRASC